MLLLPLVRVRKAVEGHCLSSSTLSAAAAAAADVDAAYTHTALPTERPAASEGGAFGKISSLSSGKSQGNRRLYDELWTMAAFKHSRQSVTRHPGI
uniref:Secreted protein n=1 Tax=Syphacia muris TaxID=451379 RepID=A0A0N5ALF9_9BILA